MFTTRSPTTPNRTPIMRWEEPGNRLRPRRRPILPRLGNHWPNSQSLSSQLWPNIAESNVKGSAPLLPSDNTATMEKDKMTSGSEINTNDAGNLVRRDNNIVQSNITALLAGSRTNETFAADIKPAADKGSGIIASPWPGESDPGAAASGQSSPWPRIADDQANFSPWPNPAHPIFAAADSRNVAGVPAGPDASSTRINALPAVANRPVLIGQTPTGRIGNPPELSPRRTVQLSSRRCCGSPAKRTVYSRSAKCDCTRRNR